MGQLSDHGAWEPSEGNKLALIVWMTGAFGQIPRTTPTMPPTGDQLQPALNAIVYGSPAIWDAILEVSIPKPAGPVEAVIAWNILEAAAALSEPQRYFVGVRIAHYAGIAQEAIPEAEQYAKIMTTKGEWLRDELRSIATLSEEKFTAIRDHVRKFAEAAFWPQSAEITGGGPTEPNIPRPNHAIAAKEVIISAEDGGTPADAVPGRPPDVFSLKIAPRICELRSSGMAWKEVTKAINKEFCQQGDEYENQNLQTQFNAWKRKRAASTQ